MPLRPRRRRSRGLPCCAQGLIRLGEGSGWGSTNANAAAIRALAAAWQRPTSSVPLVLTQGAEPERVALDAEAPLLRRVSNRPVPLGLQNESGAVVVALVDTRYQPAEPGSRAQPVQQGFVVTRQSFRVPAGGPMERLTPDADGAVNLAVGEVVEEAAEVVNPEDRTHVAIRLPLAAGMEPLNPNLATAAAEATPSTGLTLQPTWVSFQDDHVLYAYDRLPKGNYRFFFRTRALIPRQLHPAAGRGRDDVPDGRLRRERRPACGRRPLGVAMRTAPRLDTEETRSAVSKHALAALIGGGMRGQGAWHGRKFP